MQNLLQYHSSIAEERILELLIVMASHGVDILSDDITFKLELEYTLVGTHVKTGQKYSIPIAICEHPSLTYIFEDSLSEKERNNIIHNCKVGYLAAKKQFMNMLRVFGLDRLFPVEVEVKRLEEDINIPIYKTDGASGMDVESRINAVIKPGCKCLIPTGIAIAIPNGYEVQVRPRSGLALKEFVTVLNVPGSIDADFRGEIGVILVNHGTEDFVVNKGERVAQLVLAQVSKCKFVEVENLDETERGIGGFGHTGK